MTTAINKKLHQSEAPVEKVQLGTFSANVGRTEPFCAMPYINVCANGESMPYCSLLILDEETKDDDT
jgi:hypothetical protein